VVGIPAVGPIKINGFTTKKDPCLKENVLEKSFAPHRGFRQPADNSGGRNEKIFFSFEDDVRTDIHLLHLLQTSSQIQAMVKAIPQRELIDKDGPEGKPASVAQARVCSGYV
jgi:hypothetical protein